MGLVVNWGSFKKTFFITSYEARVDYSKNFGSGVVNKFVSLYVCVKLFFRKFSFGVAVNISD